MTPEERADRFIHDLYDVTEGLYEPEFLAEASARIAALIRRAEADKVEEIATRVLADLQGLIDGWNPSCMPLSQRIAEVIRGTPDLDRLSSEINNEESNRKRL